MINSIKLNQLITFPSVLECSMDVVTLTDLVCFLVVVPELTVSPSDTSVVEGQPLILYCDDREAFPTPTFYWKFNVSRPVVALIICVG